MAGFLDNFKEHAKNFHKEIKFLERTFSNPSTFYGTTHTSEEAKEFIENELQSLKLTHKEFEHYNRGIQTEIANNNELTAQVENSCEDAQTIVMMLEKFGFEISLENVSPISKDVEDTKEEIINPEAVKEEIIPDVEDYFPAAYITENVGSNLRNGDKKTESEMAADTVKIFEDYENYLQMNNIDIDEIVTPYINRNSSFFGKKTG